MSNMSYCRFQNTLRDLEDCLEHLHDAFGKHDNDRREHEARKRIVELCLEVAEKLEDEDLTPEQLGTDEDSNAGRECNDCGEHERLGLLDAHGRCESCVENEPYVCSEGHTELRESCKACRETQAEVAGETCDECGSRLDAAGEFCTKRGCVNHAIDPSIVAKEKV